ncbi:MAG: ABC transporter ATP-binding protein [Pseudomonadota bacterium]
MSGKGFLLEVRGLKTHFFTDYGVVRAVDGVDFALQAGETLSLVGESGCGKSVTGLSILRLITSPPGRIVEGSILFEGNDLLKLAPEEMRRLRGNKISMIFQEPMTSLNPVFTIGSQISESLVLHQNLSQKAAWRRSVELLGLVGIFRPEHTAGSYPHQLSGGMRQRAMIAMALACDPALLIADEPTTALDVTIQAQILDLLARLKEKSGMALLLVTHDLGVVAKVADHVAVMYGGRIFEYGTVENIFKNSRNPYTIGLLRSIPALQLGKRRLETIPGQVPDLLNLPPGCKFHPRCPWAAPECTEGEPWFEVEPGHGSRCIRWNEVGLRTEHVKSKNAAV